jgi:hypothetical protein
MWVFTKYGFYSAVCARQGDGEHGQPVDTEKVMVRARVRSHVEALVNRCPSEFESAEIVETPMTDYAFRVFLPKPAWCRVLASLADEMDYDNFKNEAGQSLGHESSYVNALHDVWQVMHRLQRPGSE